jgi:hypothetical protein
LTTHFLYEVTNKANKLLGMLRRNLYFCAKDVRETAYLSLVRPILEYAGTVWSFNVFGIKLSLKVSVQACGI